PSAPRAAEGSNRVGVRAAARWRLGLNMGMLRCWMMVGRWRRGAAEGMHMLGPAFAGRTVGMRFALEVRLRSLSVPSRASGDLVDAESGSTVTCKKQTPGRSGQGAGVARYRNIARSGLTCQPKFARGKESGSGYRSPSLHGRGTSPLFMQIS